MPVRPVLMVLYTNDAVEVRYSDGSRLHILPCGTSFSFHSHQEAHPVHGMKSVQQRCQYVTSLYRSMVLAAIDFRNRFAERPFICRELQEQDQIIDLYAKIQKVGWPKHASDKNCEVLDDGSVRLTSEDEFGSVVLSPHRKDFTMCYLSALSQEKRRERSVKNKHRDNLKRGSKCHIDELKYSETHKVTKVTNRHLSEKERPRTPENVLRQLERNDKPDGKMSNDLNISPITQASCADSPQALSNASGSPISPLDALKDGDAKFRPFSTPTQELDLDEPVCTPYGSTAVFRDYKTNDKYKISKGESDNKNGSYLGESNGSDMKTSGLANEKQSEVETKNLHHNHRDTSDDSQTDAHFTTSSFGSNDSGSSCDRDGAESKTKCSYCWVTRHMSCEECPVTWSHVLKLAQGVAENKTQVLDTGQSQANKKKAVDTSSLRKINKDECVFSQLPQPLPLSCPGQHLHKTQIKKVYQDDKDPLEDPSTFSQGHLKVLLIDGVIYRIVRHSSIKVVEVYPGDGSVLVSQGMSAHFFQHCIPHGDKIEERTYSIKSPPQTLVGPHNVKSLISRANRFLTYVKQEEMTSPASLGLCCWKHEEMAILEPLSTTMLEDCTIPGYGKFTALSNGQVRIVFQDRTCLDMTCDFSGRIQKCLDHSNETNIQMLVPDKKAGTCRLLLPNGQYQMVDAKQPGMYKRYIDVAREWADWVNSSPTQRETFYKNRNDTNMNLSVERELQRIQCFNYIVDHAVLKKPNDSVSSGAFKPYNKQDPRPGPSILRNSNLNRNHGAHGLDSAPPSRCVQINSPPSSVSSSANQISQNLSSYSSHSVKPSVIGQTWKPTEYSLRQPFPEGQSLSSNKGSPLDGFNAVREALLRTSSVIKDIDHILDKH